MGGRWMNKERPEYLTAENAKKLRQYLRDHSREEASKYFGLSEYKITKLLELDI